MANFELRIYVIPEHELDEVIDSRGIHDTSNLNDKQFIEVAEELGTVYSLSRFLNLDVIEPDTDVIRAYFIDTENEEAEPIRADVFNTTFHADLIKHGEQVKYVEVKADKPFGKNIVSEEPISRTYTLVIDLNNTDTYYGKIENGLQDCSYIQDVELIGSVDNKYRVQVETDSDIDFDKLCSYIEKKWEVDVELIEEVENY